MSFTPANQSLDDSRDNYEGVWFKGKVVDNKDPLNLDRVKASVPGLYDEEHGELPWAGPDKNSPFGCGATWGVHGSPAVGSDVIIHLQQGDPNHPVYTSLKTKADAEFNSATSWGFRDNFGNKFRVLDSGLVEFVASVGVSITINPDGSLNVTAPSTITYTASQHNFVGPATFDSTVDIAGNTSVGGDTSMAGGLSVAGSMTNDSVNVGSTHCHYETESITSTPI